MFADGPGDLCSIPRRVIPKTQKMVHDASLLNTQHHKARIKGKGVAPSPTFWCSSYRKGRLRVTLDYGRQLFLLTIGITYQYFESIKHVQTLTFNFSKIKLPTNDWLTNHVYSFNCVQTNIAQSCCRIHRLHFCRRVRPRQRQRVSWIWH